MTYTLAAIIHHWFGCRHSHSTMFYFLSRRLNGDTLMKDLNSLTHNLGEGNKADEVVVWNAQMNNSYPVNYAVVVDADSANAQYRRGIGTDNVIYSSWPGLNTSSLSHSYAVKLWSFLCSWHFLYSFLRCRCPDLIDVINNPLFKRGTVRRHFLMSNTQKG